MSKEKNLKPFEKGVSGNPGGRPKWKQVTEIMKTETNQEKLAVIVDKVFDLALEGNMRAIEFIADRLEGKVAQRVEVTTNDEPIRVFNMDDWEEKEDDDNMVLIAKASSR
ncbi:DUF5681 domain-containing protein [Candidatus Marinimicrobia bacterium]|nr:DUF5681 domain-containing protein [Candidatus Neomarinimicrobiota bacterium]